MRGKRTTLATGLIFILASPAYAVETSTAGNPALDWSLEMIATFDLLANLSGGLSRGIEIPSTFDVVGDVLWGKRGGAAAHRIKLFVQGTAGGDFSAEKVGDIQIVSSIEAPNTAKLFEAWYQYTFPGEYASVLVGLHDLNTVFYTLESASWLLNSSFGNGPEISQANASLFPTTALGAVARLRPNDRTYISAGVYDGVPGNPTDPYGTHIRFDDGDGVFALAEVGYINDTPAIPAKFAIGVWYSTATFEDTAGLIRDENSGAYLIAEMPLAIFCAHGDLGMFFQFGRAQASRNAIESYFGTGLHWAAPFAGRGDDTISLGVAHARLSGTHQRASGIRNKAETAIELTYAYQLNNWLVLQPDVQFVVDPGSANGIDDAFIAGFRVVLHLP